MAGGDHYLLGVNYPWKAYGRDFGTNAWGTAGVGTQTAAYDAQFADMAQKGVHVVRWWVFADGRAGLTFDANGTPTGMDNRVFPDMDAALAMARSHNIYLDLVLLDFMFLYRASTTNGVVMGGHTDVVSDEAKTTAWINLVVTPLLQRYGHDPYVLAWEVMNEPEWIISDIPQPSVDGSATPVTMAQFWRMASQVTAAVHTHTLAYATVGSACLKWNRIWTNAYADAHGLPRLNLDFYQAHYYAWMDNLSLNNDPQLGTVRFNPLLQDYAPLQLDRPMVIAEFDASASKPATQYDTLLSRGYAGAWPWDYYDSGSVDWSNFMTWERAHQSLVAIPGSP